MADAQPILAWTGTAQTGRVQVRTLDGQLLSCAGLDELAVHLRQREDPWGGLVRCAAALGIALHAMRRAEVGGDGFRAVDEAAELLRELPVEGVVTRLRACAEKHRDLLTGREAAARLVLEARRVQREQAESAAAAAAEAGRALPSSGALLLAWPGGPACDLADGLLTGAVLTARRPGGQARDVQVAGPAGLIADAVARLATAGIAAMARDPADPRPPAAVLLRCSGDGRLAEGAAVALAAEAARRGAAVLAVGVRCGPALASGAGLTAVAGLPRLQVRLGAPPRESA